MLMFQQPMPKTPEVITPELQNRCSVHIELLLLIVLLDRLLSRGVILRIHDICKQLVQEGRQIFLVQKVPRRAHELARISVDHVGEPCELLGIAEEPQVGRATLHTSGRQNTRTRGDINDASRLQLIE